MNINFDLSQWADVSIINLIPAFAYSFVAFFPVLLWQVIERIKTIDEIRVKKGFLDNLVQSNTKIIKLLGGPPKVYFQRNNQEIGLPDFWRRFWSMLIRPLFILTLITLLQYRSLMFVICAFHIFFALLFSEILRGFIEKSFPDKYAILPNAKYDETQTSKSIYLLYRIVTILLWLAYIITTLPLYNGKNWSLFI